MKAVFVTDVDKEELGEAVATITANGITFFARGVIRPLPKKMYEDLPAQALLEYDEAYGSGWNACLTEITWGETK